MNRLASLLLLGLTATLVSPAFADGIDNTPVPKAPKPDMSSMAFLVGTWNCEEKSARRPTSSTATTTYSLDATGYWLIGKTSSAGVPWYPYPTTGSDSYTYDSGAKRWIDLGTSDSGGYGFSTSPGWSGNTMVWHEVSAAMQPGTTSDADTTYTKVSDTKLTYDSSFTTSSGSVVGVVGSCTKQ